MTYDYDGGWASVDENPTVSMLRYRYEQPDIPEDIDIIVSATTYEDYQGIGLTVYCHEGVCYEVNSSHCSCFGHEGQWEPEEIKVGELLSRKNYVSHGTWNRETKSYEFDDTDNNEIRRLLEEAVEQGRLR